MAGGMKSEEPEASAGSRALGSHARLSESMMFH